MSTRPPLARVTAPRRPPLARATAHAVATLIVLGIFVPSARPAWGQEPEVALVLLGQTPWLSATDPRLQVGVRATNRGTETLSDLSLGITLWSAVRSRSAYDLSLREDPVPATAILAQTRALDGELPPGVGRDLAFRLDLSVLAHLTTQSLVYPLKVELRSSGEPVAALRTPVIFLIRTPKLPLALAWAIELHEPIRYGPDGRFTSTALEEALGEAGWLSGAVAALDRHTRKRRPSPFDLVISPLLLDQLRRMRAGYVVEAAGTERAVDQGDGGAALASATLAALRSIAASPAARLSAYPFSAPSLPALSGGLGRDLVPQVERGQRVVTEVLGAPPDPAVLRPPGGALDHRSLEALAELGVRTVIVEPTSVRRPPHPLGFAPSAVALLEAGPSGPVEAVVPDPGVQARTDSTPDEGGPVLKAQTVLGELATVWLEQPGRARGVALVLSSGALGGLYGPLVRRLARAPFLQPVAAAELADVAPVPEGEPPARLVPTNQASFSHAYVQALRRARRLVEAYRSILIDSSPLPDALATRLLRAEAGQFLTDEAAGMAFISHVDGRLRAEFEKVRVVPPSTVTLTARTGTIPIRIVNGTGAPVRVVLELLSSHLRFAGGGARIVDLTLPEQTLAFDVELQTTGRFPVRILLRTPSGRQVGETTVVVRSTAYNRVALVITIGAALVLLALWARRLLRRTKP